MAVKRFDKKQRRAATCVMITLLSIFLVGMVAFAFEVGRMFLVRSQLQAAVDSGAALAASLELKQDPEDTDTAMETAKQFVQENRVGWLVTVPESAITVEAGYWDSAAETFSTESGLQANAVRVAANQDEEPFMFARVFGQTTFGVQRAAIAKGSSGKLDIMLCLDLSGSMADSGRIEALRNAAPVFVNVIDELGGNDKIGVMGYGALPNYDPLSEGHGGTKYESTPQSLYPADSDYVGVMEATLTGDFNTLLTGALSADELIAAKYEGWTPTGAGLRDSAHYLRNGNDSRTGSKKIIVLMSDGYANRPANDGPGYAEEMAQYAADNNIVVYTISLGNGADTNLMQSIADLTGGTHFEASGDGENDLTQQLTDAFTGVANAIKRTLLVK